MLGQDSLTENNYHLFFGFALDVLIRPWEKLISSQKYNEVRTPLSPFGETQKPSP